MHAVPHRDISKQANGQDQQQVTIGPRIARARFDPGEEVRAFISLIEPTKAGRSRKRMSMDRFEDIAVLGALLVFSSLSLAVIILIY